MQSDQSAIRNPQSAMEGSAILQGVPFGDLKRQQNQLREELEAAVQRVLASGWYILGPEVKAFENEFAEYCEVKHAVGVGNGTDAIQLALTAVGAGPGTEVITTANAGMPGTVAILQADATPVFVDVDEQTHNLDPRLIADAVTDKTRAILPVHLYGCMADMTGIQEVADQYKLPVIEDCAQAHGARLNGRRAGGIGLMGCFSFYPTKNLGALGDGGAIVTNDDQLAEKLRRLRQYGWGSRYLAADENGINSRLDELQAAILRVKLKYLPEATKRRQEIAGMYDSHLQGSGLILPSVPQNSEHVFHLYVLRTKNRDGLLSKLRAAGIGADIHYPLPTHRQPIYQAAYQNVSLPVTEALANEVLSLPMFPELTDEEVMEVVAAFKS